VSDGRGGVIDRAEQQQRRGMDRPATTAGPEHVTADGRRARAYTIPSPGRERDGDGALERAREPLVSRKPWHDADEMRRRYTMENVAGCSGSSSSISGLAAAPPPAFCCSIHRMFDVLTIFLASSFSLAVCPGGTSACAAD